jgi:hypothetical protein
MKKYLVIILLVNSLFCAVTDVEKEEGRKSINGFYTKVRSVFMTKIIEKGQLKEFYEDDEKFVPCFALIDSTTYKEYSLSNDRTCFTENSYAYEIDADTLKGKDLYNFEIDKEQSLHVYVFSKFRGDTLLIESVVSGYYFETQEEGVMVTTSYFILEDIQAYNNINVCLSK